MFDLLAAISDVISDPQEVSQCLAWTLILLSVFTKIPQIMNIYNAQSCRGLSIRGCWLEEASYVLSISYCYTHSINYMSYLDHIFLAIGCTMIIITAVAFSGKFNIETGTIAMLVGTLVIATIIDVIPPDLLETEIVQLCCLAMILTSKGLQVIRLYKVGEAGVVSNRTWSLSALSCIVSICKSLLGTPSLLSLVSYSIFFTLNMTVVAQLLYYRVFKGPLRVAPKKDASNAYRSTPTLSRAKDKKKVP